MPLRKKKYPNVRGLVLRKSERPKKEEKIKGFQFKIKEFQSEMKGFQLKIKEFQLKMKRMSIKIKRFQLRMEGIQLE